MPTLNDFDIYVTEQSLPALEAPWTELEIKDNVFSFQRTHNVKPVFKISGYIQRATMSDTETYAHQLTNALVQKPSGTFTDGYGKTYQVLVEEWDIRADPGRNRYLFSMTMRKMG